MSRDPAWLARLRAERLGSLEVYLTDRSRLGG